jgi:hypothetical protein
MNGAGNNRHLPVSFRCEEQALRSTVTLVRLPANKGQRFQPFNTPGDMRFVHFEYPNEVVLSASGVIGYGKEHCMLTGTHARGL